ncbi:MAG: YlxM family DNA-binding protein [Bacillota bacterium]|nr:YlxM family DNA-binding protein [Bacillota bacterium]
MNIDEITQASLLYDFYGQLLSKRQREVMELYHEENYTLSEIAAEFDISRQGVHDALKNAEKALKGYEEKLGLVKKFQKSSDAVRRIDEIIDALTNRLQSSSELCQADVIDDLKKVKLIIDKLED